MQRQRQQSVAAAEPRAGEAAQVQRRTARDHDLRELLVLGGERRIFVDRMLDIGDVEQRRAEHLLVVFEIFGRILDEQPVAGLYLDRRQLGKNQRVAALDLVDTHRATRFGEHFRQFLAVRETACLDVQLSAENAWRRVRHRRRPVRQHTRGDEPQERDRDAADDRYRQYPLEHREAMHAHVLRYADDEQVGRRSDRRRHTADDRRETHRHHDFRHRELRTQRSAYEYGHQQHDDRRVVHERAEHGARDERGEQCEHGARGPR